MYLMYCYHGHLKVRKGKLNEYGTSFIPDDNPKQYMTEIPFDYYYKSGILAYHPHIVFNKYMFGKVLIEKEEDIPKWKEFFKQLYSKKLEEHQSGYKKELWTKLVEEIDNG